jgi:hypothetical protein
VGRQGLFGCIVEGFYQTAEQLEGAKALLESVYGSYRDYLIGIVIQLGFQ